MRRVPDSPIHTFQQCTSKTRSEWVAQMARSTGMNCSALLLPRRAAIIALCTYLSMYVYLVWRIKHFNCWWLLILQLCWPIMFLWLTLHCTNTARSLTQAYLITFATTIVVLLTWSISSVYDIPALPNAKISSLILLRVMTCALIKLGIYRNYIMSKVRLLNRLYISMCLALEFTTYLRHNIWLTFAQAYGKVVFCTKD